VPCKHVYTRIANIFPFVAEPQSEGSAGPAPQEVFECPLPSTSPKALRQAGEARQMALNDFRAFLELRGMRFIERISVNLGMQVVGSGKLSYVS
jgi:hypothetical protein